MVFLHFQLYWHFLRIAFLRLAMIFYFPPLDVLHFMTFDFRDFDFRPSVKNANRRPARSTVTTVMNIHVVCLWDDLPTPLFLYAVVK